MIDTKKLIHKLFFSTLLLTIQLSEAREILTLSTTTSTENSGLLSALHPSFETQHNIKVNVIAVGTGKALRIGANGDVDLVFTHAPSAELEYVEKGDFIDRAAVMHNDFVIVGPANDPANITSAKTAIEALLKIAQSQSLFISRGDDSGTHKKENQLWAQASTKPKGSWYMAVGQGMGAVLRIANDKQGYTLTDRGTQIAFSDKITLKVLFHGDSTLFNPYHIMAVNPNKGPHIRYDLAKTYIDFILSKTGQTIISDYKKDGEQLFYADAK